MSTNRRQFLRYMLASLSTPYLLTACDSDSPEQQAQRNQFILTNQMFRMDSSRVFSLSVASGDPSPNGLVLWTRIHPSAYRPQEDLHFQIARTPGFKTDSFVAQGRVNAADISELNDYTVHINLDGLLKPNRHYYYRFVYDNTVSRVGRCRTAPAEDASPDLKLAVLTCQDYLNGYYGALARLAQDDSIDFVVHLGDYIYETANTAASVPLFADRSIELPSAYGVAMGLEDYRTIYRKVRRDPFMQQAMEQHTWIITTDDHETADDCYWDYERDTLGAPGHPLTEDPVFGNDPNLLMRLKLDSQQAWSEYIPARVTFDHSAAHPHDALTVYRRIKLGGLIDLIMTDTRTYRTAHPCGEKYLLNRYLPLCKLNQQDQQSMYGETQRDWVFNGITQSTAQWKVLGNQTYMGRLGLYLNENKKLLMSADAWDGYEVERERLMALLQDNKTENFVVLTGDLHSCIASHLRYRFGNAPLISGENVLGVEFMTPSVTSANFASQILKNNPTESREKLFDALAGSTVRLKNPHIDYFNSNFYGYSTIKFTPNYCEWRAYEIDKNTNSDSVALVERAAFRKHVERNKLTRLHVKEEV